MYREPSILEISSTSIFHSILRGIRVLITILLFPLSLTERLYHPTRVSLTIAWITHCTRKRENKTSHRPCLLTVHAIIWTIDLSWIMIETKRASISYRHPLLVIKSLKDEKTFPELKIYLHASTKTFLVLHICYYITIHFRLDSLVADWMAFWCEHFSMVLTLF